MINVIIALSFDCTWTPRDYSPLQYLNFAKLAKCSKFSKNHTSNQHTFSFIIILSLIVWYCVFSCVSLRVLVQSFMCSSVAIGVTNALSGQRRKIMEVSGVRRYFPVLSSSTVSAPGFLGARMVFSLPPRLLIVLNWQQYVFFNDELHSYPFSC